jgi:hypothetical protein
VACDVKPFSKPWKLVERDESLEVQDSASRTLAFVYFSDDPNRMAQLILRLPELVRIARSIDPGET